MTALVVLVSVLYLPDLIAVTADVLDENSALAGLLYVVVMAAGIVVLPFSSLPLLPFAAAAWGVLLGGTLSVIGWWAGALIAFVISRRLGRPVLLRLVGAERLESWEERVPGHASFVGIIIMRMVLPVEIPSYILGLTEAVRFPAYALASLIGIAPFAYVLLAMGGALAEEAWLRLGVIGVITTLAAYGLYLLFRRYRRRRG
jgi:uncharacterized membrane protein YdjX (TVP38/TMEM64 family)